MICNNCGKENKEGHIFCAYCGKKITVETAAPASSGSAAAPTDQEKPAYTPPAYTGTRKIELTPDRSAEHPERYRPAAEERPKEYHAAFMAAATMSSRPKITPPAPAAPAPREHRHSAPVGGGTVDVGINLEMTTCASCGARIPAVSKACTVCGAHRERGKTPGETIKSSPVGEKMPEIAPEPTAVQSKEKNENDRNILILIYAVCALVLVVAATFAIIAIAKRSEEKNSDIDSAVVESITEQTDDVIGRVGGLEIEYGNNKGDNE